ncbi:MAG: GAF domain-containing protein [Bacteroidota bacterium]|nr:GAF domain-containing protein [Bacteroidota bacterium]
MRGFRLNIAQKLAFGFGIVTISILISYAFIYNMLIENKTKTEQLSQNIVPSLSAVNSYTLIVNQSKNLIKNWVLHDSFDDTPKKIQLKTINKETYPQLKNKLEQYSQKWTSEDKKDLEEIMKETEIIFSKHKKIMDDLDSFEKYNDLLLYKKYESDVQEGNEMMRSTDSILVKLSILRDSIRKNLVASNNKMEKSYAGFRERIIISGIVIILMVIFIAFFTANSMTVPVRKVNKQVKKLADGHLPETQPTYGKDEIGRMSDSINSLIKGLKEKAKFATEIGKGNFSTHLDAKKSDVLGSALTDMRNSLEKASEEAELRRVENRERTWSSLGIAKFNEIIREHNDNPEKFFVVTISELTKYLGAQVGGLYIVNKDENEEISIDLEGFYAYGRQKFEKKSVKAGENLVGQCYLEKETIYMTDIPGGYVKISSGLGKDDPKSILIIPLKLNEEIFGIAEIASLKVLEKHEIEFAEKTAEIIASTISNIKINRQTSLLLAESNEKSERLAKQEEESRKVIQDLEEDKEKLIKKEKSKDKKFSRIENEFRNEIKTLSKKLELNTENLKNIETSYEKYNEILNTTLMVLETDMDGQVLKANKRFIDTAGISYIDISGKSIDKFLNTKRANSKEYLENRKKINKGQVTELINNYYFKGQKMTFRDNYTPFENNKGELYKVLITSVRIDNNKEADTPNES